VGGVFFAGTLFQSPLFRAIPPSDQVSAQTIRGVTLFFQGQIIDPILKFGLPRGGSKRPLGPVGTSSLLLFDIFLFTLFPPPPPGIAICPPPIRNGHKHFFCPSGPSRCTSLSRHHLLPPHRGIFRVFGYRWCAAGPSLSSFEFSPLSHAGNVKISYVPSGGGSSKEASFFSV